jgi:hypothetical protein
MGKSSRSKKAALAQTGGVAVLEQPSAKVVVDSALKSIATSRKSSTRDKAIATVAQVLKKVDADDFDKLSVKLQPNAPAAAESKVVKAKATAPVIETKKVAGGMIATSYRRTSGGAALPTGTYGALLQTAAMAGTLKGRQCRHPHISAGEAIACAKAMASAAKAA